MYIPAARERVRIRGRERVYFVLTVDRDAGGAYVVDLEGECQVEPVNFDLIFPVNQGQAEA